MYTGGVSSETLRAHTRAWCSQSTIVFYFCSLGCGVYHAVPHTANKEFSSDMWKRPVSEVFWWQPWTAKLMMLAFRQNVAAHNLFPSRFYLSLPLSNKHCHLSSFTHCSVIGLDGWQQRVLPKVLQLQSPASRLRSYGVCWEVHSLFLHVLIQWGYFLLIRTISLPTHRSAPSCP
jgi:hypothetical protein